MHLSDWGWIPAIAAAGKPGRVIWENRGIYRLVTEAGEITARLGGNCAQHPVTGDWVEHDPEKARITALLPRRNHISRKKAGRDVQEQVLAANVDVLFIVAGLDGDFNPRRIERYLVVARHCRAEPVVVLNKSDVCLALGMDPLERLAQMDRLTGGTTPAVLISALDAASVMMLHRYVEPGMTAALLGSSGTGKSTIVNALLGTQVQSTTEVRAGDSRGKHATTGRRLFRLDAGWLLIDTPGLRELEPWAPEAAVGEVFDDVQDFARRCRFRDCRHEGEPGCAVAAALQEGRLAQERFSSYQKLRGELRHLEVMQDAHAAAEHKRRWKIIHRAMRHMPDKRKGGA